MLKIEKLNVVQNHRDHHADEHRASASHLVSRSGAQETVEEEEDLSSPPLLSPPLPPTTIHLPPTVTPCHNHQRLDPSETASETPTPPPPPSPPLPQPPPPLPPAAAAAALSTTRHFAANDDHDDLCGGKDEMVNNGN